MLSPLPDSATRSVAAGCFLCTPDLSLVYESDPAFFAMLGLGPIVEGYSLIATNRHSRSMLDLPFQEAVELVSFTRRLRERLLPTYGPLVITEHGRVPPCEIGNESVAREQHCFHAHRLAFPITLDLTNSMREAALSLHEYPDFLSCWREFDWPDEYLYFERPDGTCVAASAPLPVARQFFRTRIAEAVGRPEYASWRDYPRRETVEAARLEILSEARR